MNGIQHIKVSNRAAQYEFDLYRNITVVRGNSGTGKTTLYNMIAEHTRLGADSGVNLSSAKKCVALVDLDWKNQLKNTSDSIVFIDEGAKYVTSKDFSETIKHTDNYYVIFNREAMHDIPYSADEIYEIKTSGKFHTFKKMYPSKSGHIYSLGASKKRPDYNVLLTEDSHSGLQFYENLMSGKNVRCETSGSNSAIYNWLSSHSGEKVLVIADGAAFGSEMDRVMKLQQQYPDRIMVCLPESFEWLILKSGLIGNDKLNISEILENASIYIDSKLYFSWENYFEQLLVSSTEHTHFQYTKSRINDIYLIEENSRKIVSEIEQVIKK